MVPIMRANQYANLRSWVSRYGMPTAIVVGVIVGALFSLYIGLVGVSFR